MSTLLRARLAEGEILRMPGAFNAMSARIIADGGYPVMALSEYAVATSLLGTADRGLVTLDEMAATARYITAAVQTPLLVDAGRGHGNAINAMRAAEMFIQAGAAGMHMGDHDGLGDAIPVEEAAGKIAAYVHVREKMDPDFLVIARLDGGARRWADGRDHGSPRQGLRGGGGRFDLSPWPERGRRNCPYVGGGHDASRS
ncbi:MAG: isocitrate lyase/PEP mutase family protein [Alphaproteobacteria bacterium]